ncbi:hypothetical protein GEMRC1_006242 [Eukaryota sp. GEM-RC1]
MSTPPKKQKRLDIDRETTPPLSSHDESVQEDTPPKNVAPDVHHHPSQIKDQDSSPTTMNQLLSICSAKPNEDHFMIHERFREQYHQFPSFIGLGRRNPNFHYGSYDQPTNSPFFEALKNNNGVAIVCIGLGEMREIPTVFEGIPVEVISDYETKKIYRTTSMSERHPLLPNNAHFTTAMDAANSLQKHLRDCFYVIPNHHEEHGLVLTAFVLSPVFRHHGLEMFPLTWSISGVPFKVLYESEFVVRDVKTRSQAAAEEKVKQAAAEEKAKQADAPTTEPADPTAISCGMPVKIGSSQGTLGCIVKDGTSQFLLTTAHLLPGAPSRTTTYLGSQPSTNIEIETATRSTDLSFSVSQAVLATKYSFCNQEVVSPFSVFIDAVAIPIPPPT